MVISLIPDSVAVLIMRDDFKILACSRKDDPDEFGLPGGKVDVYDGTFNSAASRELTEETGVVISDKDFMSWHSGICKGSTNYMNHTFLVVNSFREDELDIEPRQIKGEGRVAWIPPLLLLHGPFADYNRIILEKVGYIITDHNTPRQLEGFEPYTEQKTIDDIELHCGLPSKESLLRQIEVCPE